MRKTAGYEAILWPMHHIDEQVGAVSLSSGTNVEAHNVALFATSVAHRGGLKDFPPSNESAEVAYAEACHG